MRLIRFTWQQIILTILLAVGSTGILYAVESASLSLAFDLIDDAPPNVSIANVNPSVRTVVPDPIQINFSEEVLNLDVSDFVLTHDGSNLAITGAVLTQLSSTTYELNLGSIPSSDGNYVLTLPNSSDVTDRFSKGLIADGSTSWTMSSLTPIILSQSTSDSDADGFIDQIDLVFNKAVNDTSVEASDFIVAGYSVLALNTGSSVDDNILHIQLTELSTPDTGSTPQVTYAADGDTDLEDLAGQQLANWSLSASDGAGPAIVSASTQTLTNIEIVFSESIDDSSIDLSDIIFSLFATSAANGNGVSWNTGSVGDDDRIVVELGAAIGKDEDGYVAFAAPGVCDDALANANMQTSAILIDDEIAPVINPANIQLRFRVPANVVSITYAATDYFPDINQIVSIDLPLFPNPGQLSLIITTDTGHQQTVLVDSTIIEAGSF